MKLRLGEYAKKREWESQWWLEERHRDSSAGDHWNWKGGVVLAAITEVEWISAWMESTGNRFNWETEPLWNRGFSFPLGIHGAPRAERNLHSKWPQSVWLSIRHVARAPRACTSINKPAKLAKLMRLIGFEPKPKPKQNAVAVAVAAALSACVSPHTHHLFICVGWRRQTQQLH